MVRWCYGRSASQGGARSAIFPVGISGGPTVGAWPPQRAPAPWRYTPRADICLRRNICRNGPQADIPITVAPTVSTKYQDRNNEDGTKANLNAFKRDYIAGYALSIASMIWLLYACSFAVLSGAAEATPLSEISDQSLM